VTTYLADPMAVACTYLYCTAQPGERCTKLVSWSPMPYPPARKPHAARIRLALVLAAHADPVLDEFFPHHGPCELCSTPGLGARHRVIDAMAGRMAAGEDPGEVAADYGVPAEAAEIVAAWSLRWAGAWE
jgi:hypothetical protein